MASKDARILCGRKVQGGETAQRKDLEHLGTACPYDDSEDGSEMHLDLEPLPSLCCLPGPAALLDALVLALADLPAATRRDGWF